MRFHQRFTSVLLFGLMACGVVAAEDEALPPHHEWTVGDLVKISFSTTKTNTEDLSYPDVREHSVFTNKVRLEFIDRVDQVQDGRVLGVTRHFKVASTDVEGDVATSELEGRQVKVTRGATGEFKATWTDGRNLEGESFDLVKDSPWLDVDRAWHVALGPREGTFKTSGGDSWKAQEALPSFVPAALEAISLNAPATVTWNIQVEGKFRPEGVASGEVKIVSRSVESVEGEDYVTSIEQTVTLKLSREKITETQLPKALPPPVVEDESEGEPDEGMDEEGSPDDDSPEDNGDEEGDEEGDD